MVNLYCNNMFYFPKVRTSFSTLLEKVGLKQFMKCTSSYLEEFWVSPTGHVSPKKVLI